MLPSAAWPASIAITSPTRRPSGSWSRRDRLPEAIGVLDEAVYVLRRSCEGSTTRAGMLLWPLLAMLARHLDAFGDRARARRIAALAEREAVCGESRFGRDATRVLLRHLAQRRA